MAPTGSQHQPTIVPTIVEPSTKVKTSFCKLQNITLIHLFNMFDKARRDKRRRLAEEHKSGERMRCRWQGKSGKANTSKWGAQMTELMTINRQWEKTCTLTSNHTGKSLYIRHLPSLKQKQHQMLNSFQDWLNQITARHWITHIADSTS